MSLHTSLLSAEYIEVNNGILTLLDRNKSVLYSCFAGDVTVNHPDFGKGKIVGYKGNKWICDFDASTSLIEVKTKTLYTYLN